MPDLLTKLRPDRELQCYFQQPSAIAALSGTSANAFTVSGCWRQQFDWAVVEWSRDNVYEHPALRNLPDGDLSGVRLSYEETRTNCIPLDSTSYDSIGWSFLRIWEESGGAENFHRVSLKPYATPGEGSYTAATVTFELDGVATVGDYIELAWLDQHFNYLIGAGDTTATAAAGLAAVINSFTVSNGVSASAAANQITLTYPASAGTNANRVGVYGTVHGAGTESWSPGWALFSGGASPTRWRVELDFGNLLDTNGQHVTTTDVRKLRWTWAADLQFGDFQRSEFQVLVSNWQVSGSSLSYSVAGPGSRRIQNNAAEVVYSGTWIEERGNYSGGSIHHTVRAGASLRCAYYTPYAHTLYLGTRYADNAGAVAVQVDSNAPVQVNLKRSQEDVLIRVPLGQFGGQGNHTVNVTHTGNDGTDVFFDFLEIAIPTTSLPVFQADPITTLATDWDTNHSIAIAPERSAWLIKTLGFNGRANHYAGAMWFYELTCPGNQYASGTIVFSGAPRFGDTTQITVAGGAIQHQNLLGDTADSVAKCFELLIGAGSTSVWAQADGGTLRITARGMGTAGNAIIISASTGNDQFTATVSGATLSGGVDGTPGINSADGGWRTDLNAMPRLNRAARDWSRSFFRALQIHGIDVAAAFSTELRHGDTSVETGIAQRYMDGPCTVNTPAVQTNFGPASAAFWKQVYLDMAGVMADAGLTPFLQFGEVQWWYFADGTSMPFYDDYTAAMFQATYGRPMRVIPSQNADPSGFSQECQFLPNLIGQFTQDIMSFVRQTYPQSRFEVLYPPDVNDTALNKIINFPGSYWTPAALTCLKTENFTYTGDRNLNKARESIQLPDQLKFPKSQRSHLVGIGDSTTPWERETRLAVGTGVESVVLFALDQFCLIGYSLPLERGPRRARLMGI